MGQHQQNQQQFQRKMRRKRHQKRRRLRHRWIQRDGPNTLRPAGQGTRVVRGKRSRMHGRSRGGVASNGGEEGIGESWALFLAGNAGDFGFCGENVAFSPDLRAGTFSGLEPATPRPQTPTPRHPLRARERGELGGSVSRRLRATKRTGVMDLRGSGDSLAVHREGKYLNMLRVFFIRGTKLHAVFSHRLLRPLTLIGLHHRLAHSVFNARHGQDPRGETCANPSAVTRFTSRVF